MGYMARNRERPERWENWCRFQLSWQHFRGGKRAVLGYKEASGGEDWKNRMRGALKVGQGSIHGVVTVFACGLGGSGYIPQGGIRSLSVWCRHICARGAGQLWVH